MRVSEFIEWLKTQPQDATVRTLNVEMYSDGEGCSIWFEDFRPEFDAWLDGDQLRIGNDH